VFMQADEILAEAWKAVQKSKVPEHLQAVALQEAVSLISGRAGEPIGRGGSNGTGTQRTRAKAGPTKRTKADDSSGSGTTPDEKAFFANLAKESGVSETDLRDVFELHPDGTVSVQVATKDLGPSKQAQTRTVVALIAGARSHGLEESSVSGEAVRNEVTRKRCYDQANYTSKHIGGMKGFNSGAKGDIILTSKWLPEFEAAVNQALGRDADSE